MLNRLEIENYKSLHNLAIDLPKFAVLVGANAAGKSNVADALDFLSCTARIGLPNAVSDKGGYENICFRRARRAKGAIRFRICVSRIPVRLGEEHSYELAFDYDFSFRAAGRAISSRYTVKHERLSMKVRDVETGRVWENQVLYEYPSKNGLLPGVETEALPPLLPPRELLRQVTEEYQHTESPDDLMLTSRFKPWPPFALLIGFLSSFRVFRVTPSHARQPASASGASEMGPEGDNLPAALRNVARESTSAFERLLDHLRLAVPTVTSVETDYVETRELGLFLKENGIARRMYASELSDGTVRTIGLFLPLVDKRYRLLVIEEPENCTHPWVTRQFVTACREESSAKQIILTTHAPVLVSELHADELFVVERVNGETRIRAVEHTDEVQAMLRKGAIDLGAHWDSGALGGVPVQMPLFDEAG